MCHVSLSCPFPSGSAYHVDVYAAEQHFWMITVRLFKVQVIHACFRLNIWSRSSYLFIYLFYLVSSFIVLVPYASDRTDFGNIHGCLPYLLLFVILVTCRFCCSRGLVSCLVPTCRLIVLCTLALTSSLLPSFVTKCKCLMINSDWSEGISSVSAL